jgi:hypothetical protein
MKHTLRSHFHGLLGFALTVTLCHSAVRITQTLSPTKPTALDPSIAWIHGRTYSYRFVGGMIGCGMTTTRIDEVIASDGAYLERTQYGGRDPDDARRYVESQLPALHEDDSVWPITAGDQIKGGRIVALRQPRRLGTESVGGTCRFVFVRVDGSTASIVFGPSPEHILDYATTP